MAKGQTTWPEAVKAACIGAAQGGLPTSEISTIYGVPERTVQHWLQIPPQGILAQQVAGHQKNLADKLEALAHAIVDQAPDKIEAATLPGSMTGLGIAVDKMRLLREQPTSITENIPTTLQERDALLMAVLDEIERQSAIDVECQQLSIG